MESRIHLRLYEELNDFLPPERRKRRFACGLNRIATVEDLLGSLGVPGDQVELVLLNGDSVGFSHPLADGDFVSVYPVFESFDVKPLVRARSRPLRQTRFLVEPGLSRLARYLRASGFDALDSGSWPREKIIRVAEEERRILLTHSPVQAQSPELSRVYFVRSSKPRKQLMEVLSRFDLTGSGHLPRLRPFLSE